MSSGWPDSELIDLYREMTDGAAIPERIAREHGVNDHWVIVDRRTGERATVACYFTEERAWRAIAEWFDRQARGGRPDITRELLENLTVVKGEPR